MDSCEILGVGNPSDTFNSIRSVLLTWVRCALYKGLQPDERSQKFHCFESYSIVLLFLHSCKFTRLTKKNDVVSRLMPTCGFK